MMEHKIDNYYFKVSSRGFDGGFGVAVYKGDKFHSHLDLGEVQTQEEFIKCCEEYLRIEEMMINVLKEKKRK